MSSFVFWAVILLLKYVFLYYAEDRLQNVLIKLGSGCAKVGHFILSKLVLSNGLVSAATCPWSGPEKLHIAFEK